MRHPGLSPAAFQPDRFTRAQNLVRPGGLPLESRGELPLEVDLALVPSPTDLSGFDGLILEAANRSNAPLCVGLRLDHANGAVCLTGAREELAPGQTRTIFFPWSGFGCYGRPGGFARVVQVAAVIRREKGQPDPAEAHVALLGLRAAARDPLTGPRLTAHGLHLALAAPGQWREEMGGKTPEASQRGAGEKAPNAGRIVFPPWAVSRAWRSLSPPVFPYPAHGRAQTLAGKILGHDLGLPPDWSADPEGELEWSHFLHRHHFARSLSSRPALLARTLADWIRRHPVPLHSDGGAGPAWESLSTAWRLREWVCALAPAWSRAEFPNETRALILRCVWEHARHLADHRGHPGNWRLVEAAGLALAGLVFGVFREAPAWADLGLKRLTRETAEQFLADGFHVERSPLYHALCAQACLEVRLACDAVGRPFPAEMHRAMPGWFSALAALARPDGCWPSLNDSAGADRDYRPLLRLARKAGVTWPRRPAKVDTLPRAGFAALKGRRAWVLFKAGPRPPAHAHDDDMSLEVSLDGAPLLVDPGLTRYAPSARTDAYRSAEAHSCLLDASLTGRAGELAPFRTSGLAGVSATRTGPDSSHTRHVFLADGAAVAVRDQLEGEADRPVRVCWQFAPGALDFDPRTGRARAPAGLFVPLCGRAPFEVRRVQGFVSLSGRDEPAARLEFDFAPLRAATLWWVFLPSGLADETNTVTEIVLKRDRTGEADIVLKDGQAGLADEMVEIDLGDGRVMRLASDPWRLVRARPGRTS